MTFLPGLMCSSWFIKFSDAETCKHTMQSMLIYQDHIDITKPEFSKRTYCGGLNVYEVPIFMVFVEGPIHEFQYP